MFRWIADLFRRKAPDQERTPDRRRCERCSKSLLRHSEFRSECGRAGMLLHGGSLVGGSADGSKVPLFRELESQKGWRCTGCGQFYCQQCLLSSAPQHPNGGKACPKCGGNFLEYE
jgi:uncharacterized protein with PIN domain